MRLKITLRQPHDEVRRLVKIAAHGINDTGMTVWIKNCGGAFAGTAYCHPQYCVIRIGQPSEFSLKAQQYRRLKTAPVCGLNTWQEALPLVVAHDLRHLQRHRQNKRGGEVDAERWPVTRLGTYRSQR